MATVLRLRSISDPTLGESVPGSIALRLASGTIGLSAISDTTALGTLTEVEDAAYLLGANAAGTFVRRVPLSEGGGGGGANLNYTASPTQGVVTSDTGTDATIPLGTGTNAGLLAPAQFTKLANTSGTNTGDQNLSGYLLIDGSRAMESDLTVPGITFPGGGSIYLSDPGLIRLANNTDVSGNLDVGGTVTAINLSGTNTGDQNLSSYATTAAVAAGYQPLDADLTAIAALTTTSFGRGLLTETNAGSLRTTAGLGSMATVTPTGTPDGSKFLRDDNQWTAIPGGGDALVANPLSQFAATTSAQLRGVLSDETGTGAAYFQGGDLGTPSAGVLTNATGTASGLTAGTATVATTVTAANEATDTTCFPLFVTAATGDLGPKTNAGLAFNSNTATLTATAFSGPLTGNVTGNASGSSGSCTGNAATATALQTGRTINGTTFDGTANVTVTAAAGTLTGTTLNATVVSSSLTSVGVLTGGSTGAGFTVALSVATISGTLPAANMPALTGDVTTSAGAVATTLATVNSNVGSFTNANITVNAKGLITAASNGTGGSGSSVGATLALFGACT